MEGMLRGVLWPQLSGLGSAFLQRESSVDNKATGAKSLELEPRFCHILAVLSWLRGLISLYQLPPLQNGDSRCVNINCEN